MLLACRDDGLRSFKHCAAGADGAFGEDKKLQAEFREIVKAEIETAKSLFKGNAIQEHMEDYYCMAVKVGSGVSAE